ncbi:toll-like receptor 6 [Aphidius gifuensis]|uniref:toll-like receptor 6 n=1 Tax=Aphidius gifuensis TaxID=684658 RepID=UPI001CDC8110|nr:toll-like receptor 6 [Aphidius gifuensis]
MGVKNPLIMQANLVAGIFMLIAACSLVVSGSSEINSSTTMTIPPNIQNKPSNDNGTVGPLSLIQTQIELKIHTAISVILDKYFIDEFNNKLLQLNDTLEQVNQEKSLAEYSEITKKYIKSLESLVTCGNRVLSLIDHQVNLEKNLTILELEIEDIRKNNTKIEMKNVTDNKLQSMICSTNQQHSNISLESLEKKSDENNKTIEESIIALQEERTEKLKAIENEYQLNLTNKQQEMLKGIIFEMSQRDLYGSTDLLNTLISIMGFNEDNVPDNLLKKRRQLFKRRYNENQTVVVDYLRRVFDDIASTSNSQFSNKYFCNKKMSYYDSTICAFLGEYWYEIDLSHRNLAVLPKDIFTGFENLRYLHLSYNRLYYLHSGIFDNLSNLRTLNIDNNNLTALPTNIFTGLINLEKIFLSYNQLDYLESGTFNNLSNLEKLEMDVNNLTALSSDIFNGLEKLRWLNLSQNKLKSLQPGIFNNLSNLQLLKIGYNNLTALSSNIFNGLEQLNNLDLSSNQLNYLQPGAFNNLSNLKWLKIEYNNLIALSSNIFNGLEQLIILDLSSNQLNFLQPGTFNNLPNLRSLYIDSNNLTALSGDIFNGLEKLETLFLSLNKLNYLQPGTFNNLSNLQWLDIDYNNLESLSRNIKDRSNTFS